MTVKDKIIILYYDKKMTNKFISSKLNVTTQYVTKIIKKDNRYIEEKNKRKEETIIRHRTKNNESMKAKRNKLKNERLDGIMELQHIQASCELSGRKTITNRAFKKWNSSIYEYHNRTKEYRIKEEFKNKTSYSIPKKIKWD